MGPDQPLRIRTLLAGQSRDLCAKRPWMNLGSCIVALGAAVWASGIFAAEVSQDSGNTVQTAQPAEPGEGIVVNRAKSSMSLSPLRESIERARSNWKPDLLPKPELALDSLRREMSAFERYLGGPDSANAKAWFKFLKWDALTSEVAAQEPDLSKVKEVAKSFRQNILGLEYSPFLTMRAAIENYIDARTFGANSESTIKALDVNLEKLLQVIEPSSELSELQRSRELSAVSGFLTSSNQAPELVAAIRGYYSQPNVRVYVPESWVNRGLGRSVAEPNPVDECILGTRVLGDSFVQGNVWAELLPQSNGVSLRLCLDANFSSKNVGHNRGVKIYTTGYSPVGASKMITVTSAGTFTQPATASTNLQTQINSIEHRLRIIRKIASRKAAEQKSEANAIGQALLQSRLANQFNQQVESQLAQSNLNLGMLNQNRVELIRLGVPKPTWSLQSSEVDIEADITEVGPSQFAAPQASFLPKSMDSISAEVHQSLPINIAESYLGGRTIHSWEMDDLVRQFTPEVPEELVRESESEPWSISFAEHNPVEVEFEDGKAIVSLRITKLARGSQELRDAVTVSAIYRPILDQNQFTFERLGPVNLDFARSPSGIRSVTLRAFFKGKFDKLFNDRSQPINARIPTKMPRMPQVTITQIVLSHGWAQVTVN